MVLMKLNNGAFVTGNGCSFCDVYMIDIDDERIELSDWNGMVIGTIDHKTLYEPVEMIEYDSDGRMDGNVQTLYSKDGGVLKEMLK